MAKKKVPVQLHESSGHARIKRIETNLFIWFYWDKSFIRALEDRKCSFADLSFWLKMVHFWYLLMEKAVKEKN